MTFKYLQLNIWFGGKLFENIMDFLDKEQPDIVAFQEVFESDRLIQDIRRNYFPHSMYAPNFFDTGKYNTSWGTLIASKYPIIYSENIFYEGEYTSVNIDTMTDFSQHGHSIQHVQIDIYGKIMNIFTTHGIWGFDDKDNERRLSMSQAIIEQTKDKERVILSGDLNVDQNTKAIKNIEQYLSNPFRGKIKTSFNMRHKDPKSGTFDRSVVDFIFASKDIQINDAYSSAEDISDHVPLLCIFEL